MEYHPAGAYNSGPAVHRSGHRNRSRPSEGNERGKNTCPICFSELTDIIAFQPCSHILCFECSVRNRVLCSTKACPVCRAECAEVVLAGHRSSISADTDHPYEAVVKAARDQGRSDPYYGFLFENIGIERAYRKILTHSCRFCDRPFEEFDELQKHVRERHDHHYCNVCVRQLMLFTWEHKLYMHDELIRHLEEGDPADKTMTPHPECQLCRFRAFDKDDLYKHSKQRHHLCWICDRDSNKVLFFRDFFDLYEHMKDNHFVCKICSRPAEAQVTSFPTQEALTIHGAADHGDDLKPHMLFSLQHPERQGERDRQRRRPDRERGREEAYDNTENVRPVTPPPQKFNMDAAQFPALGMDEPTGSGASVAVNFTTKGPETSSATKHKTPNEDRMPKFGAPKMTENEFPTLVGTGAAVQSSGGSLWANGPKISSAPVPKKTQALSIKKAPASASAPLAAQDSFPALTSSSSGSTQSKKTTEWVSVPVKAKAAKQSGSASNSTKLPASRWDLLEEPSSPPQHHKSHHASTPTASQRSSENHEPESKPAVKYAPRSKNHGNRDVEEFDTDAFPTLAAPAKKALPGIYKTTPSKKKINHKTPNAAPDLTSKKPINRQKSEKELIAESLFKTYTVMNREEEENGTVEEYEPPAPLATVVHALPYKMKKDDFPGLEMHTPKSQARVPDQIRMPDRIVKQTEIKSQWGNTLVQYETVFTYIPPPDAGDRWNEMLAKVEPVDIKGKLKTLETFRKELLDERIPALEFWMECQRILGKKFPTMMPEVIALIPSLTAQQDVYEVAKVPIYGNPQVVKGLAQCEKCHQVVKTAEKDAHEKVHKGAR